MASPAAAPIRHVIRHLADRHLRNESADSELLSQYLQSVDDATFTALVRRHGPMVYGVCRRILGNAADADDVFQATFLVLIRRANSIRNRHSLGSWLHGVAVRLSQRVLVDSMRRRNHETVAASTSSKAMAAQLDPDVRTVLDEELDRLHERYRAPLVLCYLEGKTHSEAAAQLGWPLGTVCGRLARARTLLRSRLTRRGLAPAVAGGATAIGADSLLAAVPPGLAATTTRLATLLLSQEAATGISASVAGLVEGMVKAMLMTKVKFVAATMLVTSFLTACAGVWAHQKFASQPGDAPLSATLPSNVESAGGQTPRVDAYGDPIPAEAVARLGTIRFRHGDVLNFIRYSADGKKLITQGMDGVRIWDAASGKELHSVPKETSDNGAGLSPDGPILATGCLSGVYLWKVEDATLLRSKADGTYHQVEFSPDGKFILAMRHSGAYSLHVELIDSETCRAVWSSAAGDVQSTRVTFVNNGKKIVGAGTDRKGNHHTLHLRDALTGRVEQEIDIGTSAPQEMAVSPDGSLVAIICRENSSRDFDDHVRVWEVPSLKERFRLHNPPEQDPTRQKIFSAVRFAPDGKSLITAGGSDELVVWDAETGNEQKRISRELGASRDFTFSPDGKHLAVARYTDIRVIDLATGANVTPTAGHEGGVYYVTITPDGKTAITMDALSVVTWDAITGKEKTRHVLKQKSTVDNLAGLTRDGRTAFRINQAEKALYVWNVITGQESEPTILESEFKWAWLAGFSSDGKTLVSVNKPEKTISLLDGSSRKVLRKLEDPGLDVCRVHFTSDGNTLVVCCADCTAQVWDVATGKKLRQIGPMGRSRAQSNFRVVGQGGIDAESALSSDGKLLACGSHEKCLVIFDATTGNEVRRSEPLQKGVAELIFSPDGRMIAGHEWRDPVIHLYEVATAKRRHSLVGHRGPCNKHAFSADGTRLISGSTDSTAIIWDLTGRLGSDVKPATPADVETCWSDLASDDAERAFRATRRLAAAPDVTVPYLTEHLKPVPMGDKALVDRLLTDLNSDNFETRKKALEELTRIGQSAMDQLEVALKGNPSAEARRQLETVLDDSSRQAIHPPPSVLQQMRAVEAIERCGSADARKLLETLANGSVRARLTQDAKASLERLRADR